MPDREHILVIGGGVGGALAHDLALRGFRVTLLERGELLSGTSGRHHGLLHSGARYVLHDPEAARECREENEILRRIAPQAIEPNGGLFVAVDALDLSYRQGFLDGCRDAGIPVRPLSAAQALALEPALTPALLEAFEVPDATMDAWRLPMHFFATARAERRGHSPVHRGRRADPLRAHGRGCGGARSPVQPQGPDRRRSRRERRGAVGRAASPPWPESRSRCSPDPG